MPSPGFDPFEGEEDDHEPDEDEPIPDDEIDEPPDEDDPYDSMNEMNEKYEGEISMAMMEENIEKAKLDETKMTVSNIDPKDIPNVTVASITAAFDAMKQLGQEKAHILEQIIKAQTSHTMTRAEAYAFIQKLVVSEGEPGWAMYVGYLKGSRFLQNQSKESGKIDPYCFACGGFGMPKPVSAVPPIVLPAPCTKCYDHMLGDDVFASLKDIEAIMGKPLMGMPIPKKAEGLKANMIIVDEMVPFDEKTYEKLKLKADCVDLGKKHNWVNHTLGGHVCSVCEKLTTIAQMQENMVAKEAMKQEFETEPSPGVTVKPLFDAQNKINAKKEESSYCSHSDDEQHNWHDDMSGTLMCECGATKVKGDVPEFPTQLQQSSPTICIEFGTKHDWDTHPTLKNTCACGAHKLNSEFTKDGYCNVCMGYDWKHAKLGCKGTFTSYEDAKVVVTPKGDIVKLIDEKCPSYHPNGPKHKWEILTLSVARCSNCLQSMTSPEFVGELSIQNPEAMKKWIALDKAKKKWQMESECVNHVQLKHGWVAKDATTIKCGNCNMEIEGSELVNKVLKSQIDEDVKWHDAKCPHYPQKKHNWEIQDLTKVWCIQCTETLIGSTYVLDLAKVKPSQYAKLMKLQESAKSPVLKLGGGLIESPILKVKYGDPCPGTVTGDHHWEIHPASDQHIRCGACKFEVLAPEVAKKILKNKYGAFTVQEKSWTPNVEKVFGPNAPKLATKLEQTAMLEKLGELVAKETQKQVMGKVSLAKAEEIGKSMANEMADQIEKEVLGLQDTTTHEEIPYAKFANAKSATGEIEYKSLSWHIYRISPEIVEVSSKKPGQEHTGFARYFKLPDDWRVKSVTATFGSVGQLKGMGIKITDDTDEIMSLTGTSLSDAAGIVNPVYCSACNGWGKDLQDPNKPAKDCSVCKGTSIVENAGGLVGIDYKCGVCDGFGKIATWNADGVVEQTTPCAYCKGAGKAVTPSTYSSGLKEAFKEKKMVAEWGGDPDVDVSDAPQAKPYKAKFLASGMISAGAPIVMNDDGSIRELNPKGGTDEVMKVLGYSLSAAFGGDPCEVNVVEPSNIPKFQQKHLDMAEAQMKGWEKAAGDCPCKDGLVEISYNRILDLHGLALHPAVPGGISSHAAKHVKHLAEHIFGHDGKLVKEGIHSLSAKEFKAGTDLELNDLVIFVDGPIGKQYGEVRKFQVGDHPKLLMGYAMQATKKGFKVGVAVVKLPEQEKPKKNVDHYYPKATCYFHGQRIQFTGTKIQALAGNITRVRLEGFTQPEKGIHTFATKDLITAAGLYPETFLVDDREFIVDDVHPNVQGINTKEQYAVIIEGHLAPFKEGAKTFENIKQKYLHELEAYCKATYNVEYSALNEKNKKVCAEQFEKDEKQFPGEPSDEEMEKFCWATYGEYFHKMNLQKQTLMKIEYAKTEHKYAIPQGQKPGKSLEDMSLKVGPVRIKGGKFEHLEDLDGWHHEKEGVCLKHDGKVVMRIRGDGKVTLDEDQHFMHDMSTPLAKEFIQAFWTGVGSNNPFLKRYSDALDEIGKQEKELAKLYKIIGHFALRDERIKQRTEGDPMVARFRNIATHMEDESGA